MDSADIRYLGDLQRLELKPGDRFILTVDRPISMEMQERLQTAWRQFFGGDEDKFRLLVLDAGMKIGVINREAA